MKYIRLILASFVVAGGLVACDVSPSAPAGGTAAPSQVMTSDPADGGAPAASTSYPAPGNGSYPAPDGTAYPAPTTAP